MTTARPMNALEWALLIALSVIWGGSFLFIALSVGAFPPVTIVFLRCALAAVALLIAITVMGARIPLHRQALMTFAGMAILNNIVPQSLIVWAQGSLPSGYASILNATTPFFTVLILHVFTANDRATPLKFLGVIIGFCGVAAMIGLDVLRHSGSILPQIALLVASFFYGLSGLWGRRFAALQVPSIVAATGQLCASSLMLLPLALLLETPLALPVPPASAVLAVVALALVSTALAYVVYFRILATAGASNLSLVTFLIPVSAIVFGILFLGEALMPRHIMGVVLIGVGLACIDGRPLRHLGLTK